MNSTLIPHDRDAAYHLADSAAIQQY